MGAGASKSINQKNKKINDKNGMIITNVEDFNYDPNDYRLNSPNNLSKCQSNNDIIDKDDNIDNNTIDNKLMRLESSSTIDENEKLDKINDDDIIIPKLKQEKSRKQGISNTLLTELIDEDETTSVLSYGDEDQFLPDDEDKEDDDDLINSTITIHSDTIPTIKTSSILNTKEITKLHANSLKQDILNSIDLATINTNRRINDLMEDSLNVLSNLENIPLTNSLQNTPNKTLLIQSSSSKSIVNDSLDQTNIDLLSLQRKKIWIYAQNAQLEREVEELQKQLKHIDTLDNEIKLKTQTNVLSDISDDNDENYEKSLKVKKKSTNKYFHKKVDKEIDINSNDSDSDNNTKKYKRFNNRSIKRISKLSDEESSSNNIVGRTGIRVIEEHIDNNIITIRKNNELRRLRNRIDSTNDMVDHNDSPKRSNNRNKQPTNYLSPKSNNITNISTVISNDEIDTNIKNNKLSKKEYYDHDNHIDNDADNHIVSRYRNPRSSLQPTIRTLRVVNGNVIDISDSNNSPSNVNSNGNNNVNSNANGEGISRKTPHSKNTIQSFNRRNKKDVNDTIDDENLDNNKLSKHVTNMPTIQSDNTLTDLSSRKRNLTINPNITLPKDLDSHIETYRDTQRDTHRDTGIDTNRESTRETNNEFRSNISPSNRKKQFSKFNKPNKFWTNDLENKWGEVDLLLRRPLDSESDMLFTIAAAEAGLIFTDQLNSTAKSLNMLRGTLHRILLPYDNNTRIDSQCSTPHTVFNHLPNDIKNKLSERTVHYLVSGANSVRQLVRVKIADDNDLEQAIIALKTFVTFFKQLQIEADNNNISSYELLQKLK